MEQSCRFVESDYWVKEQKYTAARMRCVQNDEIENGNWDVGLA